MKSRRKARELALLVLYQFEVGKEPDILSCMRSVIAEFSDLQNMILNEINDDNDIFYNDYPIDQEVIEYSSGLLKGIKDEWDTLNKIISNYAKAWTLERILIIDRNILRIAIYEFFFIDDVPIKVSINEAVELAKFYSGVESKTFINGILDKIYKKELYKDE